VNKRPSVSADQNPRLFAAAPFEAHPCTEVCVNDAACQNEG
jgi:hypothetical protein